MSFQKDLTRLAAAAGLGAGIMYFLSTELGLGPASARSDSRTFSTSQKRSTADLEKLLSQTLPQSSCPSAVSVVKNIPIYDCSKLDITTPTTRETLMTEFYNMLLHGPGVLVLKNMYRDHALLDEANSVFSSIIASERASERASSPTKGDHFSAGATNSRIWNSFSKHGLSSPSSFVKYYSNPFLSLISESYLGPAYRITTQLNIVHPSGPAQTCHRDYHLGFQTASDVARWPRAMHVASQLLTLQGAVAHTDMPLLSGPTRLLPFSQLLEDGFMCYRDEEFQKLFLDRYVALPLEKGDGLFFNPALFHAAGENRTSDFDRSANLVQVSSAFGKTMESVDAVPLVEGCWGELRGKVEREGVSEEVRCFVKAVAEGYPFPTNLDRRPPAPGGMAPESEQGLLLKGLEERWGTERVVAELKKMREDSKA
ncbi:hypothetical protein C1H76_1844 [Elsinoe australis]|uniref:Uncharacterized protein n=1 Tax=Elsinoe australis TaxID=40998 RepID=A0A4U7BDB5_9PEZI|nr:hypothetical protein C1H76_1844 [Elsinoe australis]